MPQTRSKSARRKKSGTPRKSQPLEFVQGFIPLKEIRNGIVETTDGRYLKILEIEPINFLLRSEEEQWGIISSFASWLKISPMRLQFKSVTRKADSDKYIAGLDADLAQEENDACRELGEGIIRFIREEGSREALSRRFFLIFQYEAPSGRRQMGADYGEVYAALQTAVQNARTYFTQCGNSIVQPKDEDAALAEILYMYFNRRSCVDDPFAARLDRVVVDAMAAKKRVIGLDPVPHIQAVNFVAPRGLDLTHPGYIVMDGTYYTYLYIRKDGYPQRVRGGWMSALINAGEGVDVDLHLRREIRGRTIDRVAQRIRLNRTKIRGLQDTSTDYEELAGSIQAGYYIKQGLSSYNEDLFYMSVLITISAATHEELVWRRQQMTDLMKSMDIQVGDCNFQQEAALRSTMPFLYLDPSLERKAKRNVLTSGAASTYLFTSFELSDDNGILLGLNRHNNSLCIVDPFNTRVNKNASFTICGTTGAGKTYTIQTMALRLRARGVQCFILAPLKGHEFKRACHRVGGSYIKLAPGSNECINVMAIRPTITPEMELIDELDYNDIDSMLAWKIQQLMIFFSLLVPDMTNEEEQMLDEALVKTYGEFGITHDNDSLYTDSSRTAMRPMPILGDLHRNLKENPLTNRLATILSRFVTGSAQSFNRQTNVNLENKYVVLDISELKGKLLPVGMIIALDYVWDTVKADRTKKKMIFIDEIWKLIGGTANKQATEFCLEIFKIIRGYGGGAVAATQDLSDFFSLEEGRYGRAIINNCKTKIILNLEQDEAEYVKDVLKLTRSEIRSITQFERGEALISSNSNKVPVIIKASKEEQRLITTDRAELEALVAEKKREAQVPEEAMAGQTDEEAAVPR